MDGSGHAGGTMSLGWPVNSSDFPRAAGGGVWGVGGLGVSAENAAPATWSRMSEEWDFIHFGFGLLSLGLCGSDALSTRTAKRRGGREKRDSPVTLRGLSVRDPCGAFSEGPRGRGLMGIVAVISASESDSWLFFLSGSAAFQSVTRHGVVLFSSSAFAMMAGLSSSNSEAMVLNQRRGQLRWFQHLITMPPGHPLWFSWYLVPLGGDSRSLKGVKCDSWRQLYRLKWRRIFSVKHL
ncbi:hypothetical protein ILYODFUR_004351 [Ilyodon furcidens]|uniref:Uncharacterized protein n=1 Tax=Ilyodon furcidens TaxID=33524 RepID=A0ABV0UE36_9TELE